MTDFIPTETPYLAICYCPTCEPDRDPTAEILDVRFCDNHNPNRDGAQDHQVVAMAFLSGSAEAGGECNQRWCDLLHRGIVS